MTLDRYISRSGVASRTQATEWINEGRVQVNNRIERDAERWVNTNRDRIKLDGREVADAEKLYLMLNKPSGVITSYGDPKDRKTVYEYIKGVNTWVFPVGRLDKDTSGLLLMTNDTDFGNRLTDPKSKVAKHYIVKVNALMNGEEVNRLRSGVEIEPGELTQPCDVNYLRKTEKYSWLEIILTEGKNRQVRRMIEALGHQVLKLVRVQIGRLTLENLMVGRWRFLTREEVRSLMDKRIERRMHKNERMEKSETTEGADAGDSISRNA